MRRDLFIACTLSLSCVTSYAYADGDDLLAEQHRQSVAGGGVLTAGVGLSMRVDGVRNPSGTLQLNGLPAGATVDRKAHV